MAAAENLITQNLDIWASAIKAKSSAGRGTSKKIELYGIKKLRELILELAVRGLLVPQDPNDEPASELLKKIAAKKAKLVNEGKLKKQNPLPPISEEEKPFELPKGWEWVRLTEIYYSISPSSNKLKSSEIIEIGKYPVVDQGQNFISGYSNLEELVINIPQPVIIFGDHTTNIKYIDFDFIAGADGTKILVPITIYPKYFYTYLLSLDLENRGYARHFKVLNDNLFAIPSTGEQNRIVAKVDELMALCDKLEAQQEDSISVHETLVEVLLSALTNAGKKGEFEEAWKRISENFDVLFTTENSISQLKQTILQLAVMGKLVPQDPKDEPVSELLKKIAAQKAKLVKEGKIKKHKPLPPIREEEKPFELPEGWEWARFGDIAQHNAGKTLDSGRNTGTLRDYITTSNLYWGRFDLSEVRKMLIRSEELEKCTAQKGDLLICEGGEAGRAAVWTEDREVCFQNHVHRARFYGGLNSFYAYRFFEWLTATGEIDKYRKGVAISNMSGAALASIPYPLPSLLQQNRIVAKVDELMALCDRLLEKIRANQTTQLEIADCLGSRAIS